MLRSTRVHLIFLILFGILIISYFFTAFSAWFLAAFGFLYTVVLAAGASVLSLQFFIPVHSRGARSSGSIAITFDDGPIPGNTEKLLELLGSRHIAAGFFCIGRRVAENPDLVRRIHREGHLIGNHSYWHKNTFDLQTSGAIEKELTATNDVILQTIGARPRFFRPPYGVTNPMVARAIRRCGFETIGWSVRSFDTMSKNHEALFKRVTASLKSGDIVLFHDYCSITLDILPRFLDYVSGAGLKIVRVDELLKLKAYGAE